MTENKKRKLDLFEDSDDDDLEVYSDGDIQEDFECNKHEKDKKRSKKDKKRQEEFEEIASKLDEKIEKSSQKKTSKIIELQSKFAYDSRFTVDERFVEDEEDEEEDGDEDDRQKISKDDDKEENEDLTKERSKNLSILEHVLGKQIQSTTKEDPIIEFRKSQVSKKASSAFSSVLVPRFDPSKEDSKQFELRDRPGKNDQKLNIDFDELDRRDEEIKKKELEKKRKASLKGPLRPSGQTDNAESFYEVNANLKDTFGDSGNFVFDSFFDPKLDVDALNDNAQEQLIEGGKKTFGKEKNPFKYDSSDDEDDQDKPKVQEESIPQPVTKIEVISENIKSSNNKTKERKKLSTIEFSGFFFKKNDLRLLQEPFWNEELSKNAKNDSLKRKERMRIALGLRKKAALKNVQLKKRIDKKRALLTPKQFQASQQKSQLKNRNRKFKKPFLSKRR